MCVFLLVLHVCIGKPNSSDPWKVLLSKEEFIHLFLSITDPQDMIKAAGILSSIVTQGYD